MAAVRVMAKDLVRTRQHISKFTVMKSNLQSLSLQMQVRVVVSRRLCRALLLLERAARNTGELTRLRSADDEIDARDGPRYVSPRPGVRCGSRTGRCALWGVLAGGGAAYLLQMAGQVELGWC